MKKIFTLIVSTLALTSSFATGISGDINKLKSAAAKVPASQFKASFVSKPGASKDISILPGTASDAAAKFTTKKSGLALVKVFDANGKIALQELRVKTAGTSKISISDVTNLNDGTYSVVVDVNKTSFSTQLMIWK